jgi:hypothetical protein
MAFRLRPESIPFVAFNNEVEGLRCGNPPFLTGGVDPSTPRGTPMAQAMQALLPFLRGAPRTARSAALLRSEGGLERETRLARSAFPLRHHAIRQIVDQLELRFVPRHPAVFVHEGARQALERRLELCARQTVVLSITDNRHSMIHATRREGVLRVRLHHMFLDAPLDVVESLARFLLFRDRDASAVVGRYIDVNATRIRPLESSLRRTLTTAGDVHDLAAIYAELNDLYFDGEVDARICWGTEATRKGKRRSTIKLGSYTAQERLIRIHPRLDQAFVPRYFVAFVVFHEMLHHVMPATRVAGRRMLHPREFRERERSFKHYEKSIAWEKANLDRLLR